MSHVFRRPSRPSPPPHRSPGTCPRNFNFTECGRFALVGNQNSNTLVCFSCCPETGKLTQARPEEQSRVSPSERPGPRERKLAPGWCFRPRALALTAVAFPSSL